MGLLMRVIGSGTWGGIGGSGGNKARKEGIQGLGYIGGKIMVSVIMGGGRGGASTIRLGGSSRKDRKR